VGDKDTGPWIQAGDDGTVDDSDDGTVDTAPPPKIIGYYFMAYMKAISASRLPCPSKTNSNWKSRMRTASFEGYHMRSRSADESVKRASPTLPQGDPGARAIGTRQGEVEEEETGLNRLSFRQ